MRPTPTTLAISPHTSVLSQADAEEPIDMASRVLKPLSVRLSRTQNDFVRQYSKLQISLIGKPKDKVPLSKLVFGHTFTDHMLTVGWANETGWEAPKIQPFANLSIPPSASVLHYGIECFEGMKAYRDSSGNTRLFRPELNMRRLASSARRLYLPDFDQAEFLECIKELLRVESSWIPSGRGYSVYIRPALIGTQDWLGVGPSNRALLFVICSPVGPYYRTGFAAVSLRAEEKFVRAWPGGTGCFKIGANYAPGILPQVQAAKEGYQQILWLLGANHEITEVGTMNCFIFWKTSSGQPRLVTPPLTDGTILPGVTRDSIIQLASRWGEFEVCEERVTMAELVAALQEGRVLEMFGSGTAAIVSPIKKIHYQGKDYAIPLDPHDPNSEAGPLARRLWDTITKIQVILFFGVR